ncbi:MAG TPA: response regulator [Candidatus Sulfotelmatobacter sp.]|jgi:two-component system chemotaxis response regulator CheY|nr:response regulator [Candidatus Sulfotelmatobacter sp.]
MKRKILVVDDSALARRLTRKILEDLGYEVEEASDGTQALEKYALGQHDAVILDMLMSGMYGLEVLQKLKELNPSLPVVVATADIQRTTRDQVKNGGAAAMINKPVNGEELAEMLDLVWKGETAWN